jgi:preprotein translocase subunit SecD
MDRRVFISMVGGSILASPLAAEAQLTRQSEAALAFFDTVEDTSPKLIIAGIEIMSVIVEPNKNGYRATIRIDSNAAQRLYQFTERTIGKRVAIRFDRERLSDPHYRCASFGWAHNS